MMMSVSTDAPVAQLTGPMPATFKISLFAAPATINTRPALQQVTLDEFVKLLTTHRRRPDKDGRGWSGATYKPGTTRKNENVIEWSVIGGDFDHLSMDEYMDLRAALVAHGLAVVLYSTHSSTPENFRFRLAIPLTKPIPKSQYTDIWHRTNARLFGGANDPGTKDASRMLYTPAAAEGVAVFADFIPGLALDWEKLPPAPAFDVRLPANGTTAAGHKVGISKQTYAFLIDGAPVGHQRTAALTATRSLLADGRSVEETAEKVWRGLEASEVGDPAKPWTYDDALFLAQDLAGREPPPLADRLNGHASNQHTALLPTASRPGHRPCTDLGNAERFVDAHRNRVRFSHPWGTWLWYDGRHWVRDQTATVRRWIKNTHRSIYTEAADADSKEERTRISDWAKRCESAASVAATLKLAEAEEGIPVLPGDLDADLYLLNVLNGTLDPRANQLNPHDPLDYITKLAPVHFDPHATCPVFMAFLARVLPDPDVRGFVQRLLGYCLTGDVGEQCLFFFYGSGANGKSTLLTVLQALLGDYAKQAAPELLVSRGGDRHPTELADLFGARLVASVEVEEGRRLAETLIKQMTGGDRMKARFMKQDFFEWTPTHKVILVANHKPEVRGTDYAIWRRIHLIPFTVTIPEGERDPKLPEKLIAEASGILNWLIAGCLDWQQEGLRVPQAVKKATNDYQREEDVIGTFITETCQVDTNLEVPSGALYAAYRAWCAARSMEPISHTLFGRRLTDKGHLGNTTGVARTRRGLGLKPSSVTVTSDS
jgi:P4 family phage/plasmid primase-like protien